MHIGKQTHSLEDESWNHHPTTKVYLIQQILKNFDENFSQLHQTDK